MRLGSSHRWVWMLLAACAVALGAGVRTVRAHVGSPAESPLHAAESPISVAEVPEPEPLEPLPPELQRVLDKLDEANKKMVDFTAQLAYEEAIPLLEEKKKSRGTLTFKKPNLISMVLRKPTNEEVHTDGKLWWVVSHKEKQVDIFEVAKEGEGAQETAFLQFGYGADSAKLRKDFLVELVEQSVRGEEDEEKETLYRIKFTPRKRKDRTARYESVEAVVSDKLWLPVELVLREPEGEIIHTYRFSKVRLNTGVKESAFAYKPPSGYAVVHAGAP